MHRRSSLSVAMRTKILLALTLLVYVTTGRAPGIPGAAQPGCRACGRTCRRGDEAGLDLNLTPPEHRP